MNLFPVNDLFQNITGKYKFVLDFHMTLSKTVFPVGQYVVMSLAPSGGVGFVPRQRNLCELV